MQFIDLNAQRLRIEEQINKAVQDVVIGGQYILGPQVSEFEEKIAAYLGVKHAIACANGTDALLMVLMAKNIGPGDAVFCPAFTFLATAEVAVLAGAQPVFVDVLPDSYNMDPASLLTAIKQVKAQGRLKPRAIIPVDLFGLAADYDSLTAIAQEHDLLLIEDAAQSIGGRRGNQMCGAFGDAATTSFYPAKPLGCYGDGGAIFTNDDALAEILRSILFHGKGISQYDAVRIGLNSRLDTIQAAILLEKMKILPDEIEMRQRVAKRYHDGLSDVVKVPAMVESQISAFAQYTIEVEDRDGLRLHLQEVNIPSAIYYIKPLHHQKAYQDFECVSSGLSISESLCQRVLSLPMHPYLEKADQDKIIAAIRNFYL